MKFDTEALPKAPEPPVRSRCEPSWRLSRRDDIQRRFDPGPSILRSKPRPLPEPARGLSFARPDGGVEVVPPELVADFLRRRAAEVK